MTYKTKVDGINVVVIAAEPDAKCEACGSVDELRPYGKNGQRLCFSCAMKPENKRYVEVAMNKLFGGCK